MEETLLWVRAITSGVLGFSLVALAISLVFCAVFLIRSGEVADRAIAFDLAMIHVVGIIAVSAMVLNSALLLDALIVIAVLGFVGTVALSRYLERGLARRPERRGTGVEARIR